MLLHELLVNTQYWSLKYYKILNITEYKIYKKEYILNLKLSCMKGKSRTEFGP